MNPQEETKNMSLIDYNFLFDVINLKEKIIINKYL